MPSQDISSTPIMHDKLLVLISNRSDHDHMIRAGRRIAERRQIPWTAVWVDTGRVQDRQSSACLQSAFALAKPLGADTEILRGPSTYQTILPFIVEHRITAVLVGSGARRRFRPWHKRLYQRLIESQLPLEVSVLPNPDRAVASAPIADPGTGVLGNAKGHLFGMLSVFVATALAVSLEHWVKNYNLVLLYVSAVVVTGLRYGSHPAILASVLSFFSFNFFLTDPRHTLEVTRQDELATLVFLFVIALICGPAASLIRRQFLLLREANRHSEAMRLLGQALSVAEGNEAVWQAAAKVLSNTFQVECCVVTPGKDEGFLSSPNPSVPFSPADEAAIEWSRRNLAPCGRFTDTLGSSDWTIFPIGKDDRCLASALIRFDRNRDTLKPHDKDLIAAMLQQAADTCRRIELVGELESARVKTEVEQLRSALLLSVSHDLKSPLSAMMGAAESLRLLDKQLVPSDREELADTILQESRRLESYIQNLLDMTQLGHGTLKIERDWVSVADIVGSAIKRLKRYFPGVKTEYHSKSPAPVLYVHAGLIEQAVFNILENAAKFSPPDKTIQITVEHKNHRCIVAVEDQGPGIPEPLREKIFDMFYVVSAGDQKRQSTGMGLAICRGMIGAHGGFVRAMTGSNHTGTRIEVELPEVRPTEAENIRKLGEGKR